MRAWHFVGSTLRDGRSVPEDGELLKFDGKPILCEQGLHFSVHPFDALQYAPGETLCLVECGGVVVMGNDKGVCAERTIITRMDATPLLRYFARRQALSVLHLYPGEPQQCVLDFLAGDDSARAAARDAARAAAWNAAGDAAWAAAWNAAGDAAWAAAWNAARAAAWNAAGDAAWAAAGDAAWAAARDAARAAARDDFKTLVNEAFEDWL
jgi:hypothetical protein